MPPVTADGTLRWEGVSLERIASERPTPFFLFSEARLLENLGAVTRGLESSGLPAVIRYCAKTNPEIAIQEVFASEGTSVLASTGEEVALALEAGFQPDDIAYQRPVLGDELRDVLRSGVRFVHAYRISDLETLERFAAEEGATLSVSLRIRDERGGMRILGSAAQRLGFAPTETIEAARVLLTHPHLTLTALNSYIGTQQAGLSRFASSVRLLTQTAAALRKASGTEIAELNIGGGIPSDSLRRVTAMKLFQRLADRLSEPSTDLDQFSAAVGTILRRELAAVPFVRRVAAEPGRSLAGSAAVLVTRVADVQGRWLFLDASHNYLCESPILFNRRIDVARNGSSSNELRYYNLSGCTLNTLDIIDWRRRLPVVDRGDLLVISDAGAYSLARNARYAGLAPAAWMIGRDGAIRMVRRAETGKDLTAAMMRREP